MTPGHDWPINAINEAIRTQGLDYSDPTSILRVAPFIEQMGTWPGGTRKEFWWEREWRHVGSLTFAPANVVALMAAGEAHTELAETISDIPAWQARDVPILDPQWGLERMIATLSRVDAADIGPFPGC
ncbi:hypothetical protein [Gordonia sihwensis]|uniref:hypothetical protein n=1 Tax=Gordonia sihwensis TaxID=173559 RepID=UPI000695B481|nr:hypothetical protein [Gordonia sihwensis]